MSGSIETKNTWLRFFMDNITCFGRKPIGCAQLACEALGHVASIHQMHFAVRLDRIFFVCLVHHASIGILGEV